MEQKQSNTTTLLAGNCEPGYYRSRKGKVIEILRESAATGPSPVRGMVPYRNGAMEGTFWLPPNYQLEPATAEDQAAHESRRQKAAARAARKAARVLPMTTLCTGERAEMQALAEAGDPRAMAVLQHAAGRSTAEIAISVSPHLRPGIDLRPGKSGHLLAPHVALWLRYYQRHGKLRPGKTRGARATIAAELHATAERLGLQLIREGKLWHLTTGIGEGVRQRASGVALWLAGYQAGQESRPVAPAPPAPPQPQEKPKVKAPEPKPLPKQKWAGKTAKR